MAQRDVVLRWIQQAARVIARLLRSGKPDDLELAQEEVASALEALLGPLALLIPKLDALSACTVLHDPERIAGYARLLGLQAALFRATGNEPEAVRTEERAKACYDIAVGQRPDLAADWDESPPES